MGPYLILLFLTVIVKIPVKKNKENLCNYKDKDNETINNGSDIEARATAREPSAQKDRKPGLRAAHSSRIGRFAS